MASSSLALFFNSSMAAPAAAALDCRYQLFGIQPFRCVKRSSSRMIGMHAVSESATLEQCQAIVAEQLGVDVSSVKAESKFSDLGADSLDTVEIVMALEEKFKIQVEQEGAEKIVTVKDAADVIHKLVSQNDA